MDLVTVCQPLQQQERGDKELLFKGSHLT